MQLNNWTETLDTWKENTFWFRAALWPVIVGWFIYSLLLV